MRFLTDGNLLVVTHLGQVLVFDAHRGTVVGNSLDLVAGIDPKDPQRGLADCRLGGPACPVAAAPAFSAATGMVVVTLWEPGADKPVVVGLRYRPGQTPLLTREWTSDAVGGGPLGSPVLSADGSTVYVNGRDERLWALDTADGTREMVGSAGLPGPDPAVGVPRRADHRRRRTGRRADGDPGQRGRGGEDLDAAPTVARCPRRAWPATSATRWCGTAKRSGAGGLRPRRRPHGEHLPVAQRRRLAGRGVDRP